MTKRFFWTLAAAACLTLPATSPAQDEFQQESPAPSPFVDDSLFEEAAAESGKPSDIAIEEAPPIPIAQEFVMDVSYVGNANMQQGNRNLGQTDEYQVAAQYVVSPEITDGLLFRGGVDFEKFAFGTPDNAPMPNTLNMLNAIVGVDFLIGDQWLMRVQAMPGVYNTSSNIRTEDVNCPFLIGGTYLYSKDVQFIFGISVDLWRKYTVLPGVGVRWQISDKWVLNAIPPSPRIEYELDKQVTLYAGIDILGDTYRSDDDFGTTHGNTKLDNALLSYWEVRTGAGVVYKPIPNISIDVSAGAMVVREMDFHRAETRYSNNEAAPYAAVRISGRF